MLDCVVDHVRSMMVGGQYLAPLEPTLVPSKAELARAQEDVDEHTVLVPCEIFLERDWEQRPRDVLVLCPGRRNQAGMLSRSLALFGGMRMGSMMDYIRLGYANDFAVVVLNPHAHVAESRAAAAAPRNAKPVCPINDSTTRHVSYVWQQVLSFRHPKCRLWFVGFDIDAFWAFVELLRTRGADAARAFGGAAFVEVEDISPNKDLPPVKRAALLEHPVHEFLANRAVHFSGVSPASIRIPGIGGRSPSKDAVMMGAELRAVRMEELHERSDKRVCRQISIPLPSGAIPSSHSSTRRKEEMWKASTDTALASALASLAVFRLFNALRAVSAGSSPLAAVDGARRHSSGSAGADGGGSGEPLDGDGGASECKGTEDASGGATDTPEREAAHEERETPGAVVARIVRQENARLATREASWFTHICEVDEVVASASAAAARRAAEALARQGSARSLASDAISESGGHTAGERQHALPEGARGATKGGTDGSPSSATLSTPPRPARRPTLSGRTAALRYGYVTPLPTEQLLPPTWRKSRSVAPDSFVPNVQPAHQRSNVWAADDSHEFCMMEGCRTKFDRLRHRKHHCRSCGRLVCDRCSGWTLPLEKLFAEDPTGDGLRQRRVCDDCIAPSLSSSDPISTQGGRIRVEGFNLGDDPSKIDVKWNGISLSRTLEFVVPFRAFMVDIPPGTGIQNKLDVTVVDAMTPRTDATRAKGPLDLMCWAHVSYRAPELVSLSPAVVPTTGRLVKLHGNNLGNDAMKVHVTVQAAAYVPRASMDDDDDGAAVSRGAAATVAVEGAVVAPTPRRGVLHATDPVDREVLTPVPGRFSSEPSRYEFEKKIGVTIVDPHNCVEFYLPPGTGGRERNTIVVTVDGQTSGPLPFAYRAPVVKTVTSWHLFRRVAEHDEADADEADWVATIVGKNFGASAVFVRVWALGVEARKVSIDDAHFTLTCTFDAAVLEEAAAVSFSGEEPVSEKIRRITAADVDVEVGGQRQLASSDLSDETAGEGSAHRARGSSATSKTTSLFDLTSLSHLAPSTVSSDDAAPVVLQDMSPVTRCATCGDTFKRATVGKVLGLSSFGNARKRNCQSCGQVVCTSCSEHTAVVRGRVDEGKLNVCSNCMVDIDEAVKLAISLQLQVEQALHMMTEARDRAARLMAFSVMRSVPKERLKQARADAASALSYWRALERRLAKLHRQYPDIERQIGEAVAAGTLAIVRRHVLGDLLVPGLTKATYTIEEAVSRSEDMLGLSPAQAHRLRDADVVCDYRARRADGTRCLLREIHVRPQRRAGGVWPLGPSGESEADYTERAAIAASVWRGVEAEVAAQQHLRKVRSTDEEGGDEDKLSDLVVPIRAIFFEGSSAAERKARSSRSRDSSKSSDAPLDATDVPDTVYLDYDAPDGDGGRALSLRRWLRGVRDEWEKQVVAVRLLELVRELHRCDVRAGAVSVDTVHVMLDRRGVDHAAPTPVPVLCGLWWSTVKPGAAFSAQALPRSPDLERGASGASGSIPEVAQGAPRGGGGGGGVAASPASTARRAPAAGGARTLDLGSGVFPADHEFVAPEWKLAGLTTPPTRATDAWALGVVLFKIEFGDRTVVCLPGQPTASMPTTANLSLLPVLNGMLQVSPKERWTLDRAIAHDDYFRRRVERLFGDDVLDPVEKQRDFIDAIDHVAGDQHVRPTFITITTRREVARELLVAIAGMSEEDMWRPVNMTVATEDAVDAGGVTAELLTEMMAQLQAEAVAYSERRKGYVAGGAGAGSGDGAAAAGGLDGADVPEEYAADPVLVTENKGKTCMPNPHHTNMDNFVGLGMALALAIIKHVTLPPIFPNAFYKILLHRCCTPAGPRDELHLSFADLADFIGEDEFDVTVRSILLKKLTEEDLEALMLDFDDFGMESRAVTDDNKREYLNAMARHRLLVEREAQIAAVCQGFNAARFADEGRAALTHILRLFNHRDLQSAVRVSRTRCPLCRSHTPALPSCQICGVNTLDAATFWASVRMPLLLPSEQVRFLRRYINDGLDEAGLRKLLRFITACDSLPVSGLRGRRRITFEAAGRGTPDYMLPVSHTCFRKCVVPPYRTYEQFRDSFDKVGDGTNDEHAVAWRFSFC